MGTVLPGSKPRPSCVVIGNANHTTILTIAKLFLSVLLLFFILLFIIIIIIVNYYYKHIHQINTWSYTSSYNVKRTNVWLGGLMAIGHQTCKSEVPGLYKYDTKSGYFALR